MYIILDICSKQFCPKALEHDPASEDKLSLNTSKNVNLLMKHSMSKRIRPFIIKPNAYLTYEYLLTYRSHGVKQKKQILDGLHAIDSNDPKVYVHEMRVL